jgi:NAD(P)-dependent dehydrogenase (short-subunit alcohol dehydrogenase family)
VGGPTVLITGAAGGIGLATARAFAANGYRVALSDTNVQAGTEAQESLTRDGAEAEFVAANVADSRSVRALVDRVLERFGSLDAAVNNAGISGPPESLRLHEYSEDAWNQVLAINLTGVWLCMREELRVMEAAGGGSIVNMASVVGLVGGEGRCPYVASKHGVVGLTRAAALEYATSDIRINAVCPSPVRTPLVASIVAASPELEARYASLSPMNRIAAPEEIAAAVLWLCSDGASFVNGAALPVDGGTTAG